MSARPDPVDPSALPAAIRAYAEQAMPRVAPLPLTVRVEQVGEMTLKPGARPRPFTAVEEFATNRVAFVWRARFPLLGPLGLRVSDGYDGREGVLDVRLLGLPLQRRRGIDLAQGEALRYLAEMAWAPQAILANPHLRWRELDARAVEVATDAGGATISLRLLFNDRGEIAQTVAERPRLEAGGAPTPWIGRFDEYRQLGGVRIPTRVEVRWDPPEGSFTYWRGRITALEASHQPLLPARR